jgi:adenine phosphoribosyltransferase
MSPDYLARIDTSGHGRYDVTPLFADARAFAALVTDLLALAQPLSFEIVAGIDALGFILGSALALRAGTGFIPIRKEGKLPVPTDHAEFVDYSGTQKALELRHDAVLPGQRVLVVDEWIETGAQVSAAIRLIEGRGGIIAGVATIHIDTNTRTRLLTERYSCVQVWRDSE